MNRAAVVRCLGAAALFGASAPAASLLAGDVPTLLLAGLLYVGAGLAVAPHALRHRPPPGAVRSTWRPLALAVGLGGALGPVLLVAGLARTPAATASLLLNLELAATVVLAATLFREHLGARLVAATALITVGGALLVWEPGATFDPAGLLIIGACICWGVDNSVTARIDQLSAEQITFAKGAVAGTANLVLGVAIAGIAGVGLDEVGAALAIGALGYGASITLWVKGARDLGASRAQVIFATAPFIGATLAWTVLGEPVAGTQVVAGFLAAAGVVLSLRTAHLHEHQHEMLEHDHEHRHDDGHHDHVHAEAVSGRHSHRHGHHPLVHAHPHVPDLHHGHQH